MRHTCTLGLRIDQEAGHMHSILLGKSCVQGVLRLRTQRRQQNIERVRCSSRAFAGPPKWGAHTCWPWLAISFKEARFSTCSFAQTSPRELCQHWLEAGIATCVSGLITALPIDHPLWHLVACSLTQWKCTRVEVAVCWMAPCGTVLAWGIRLMERKAASFRFP